MQVDIISDIHLDFWLKRGNEKEILKFITNIIRPNIDSEVLIIGGDIGHYNNQNLKLLNLLQNFYQKIFFVFGNHDLYLISRKQRDKYKFSLNRLKELIENLPENVMFLNGFEYEYKGVRFAGSGLWYEVKDINLWLKKMNDAIYIIEEKIFNIDYDSYGKKIIYKFNPLNFYQKEMEKLRQISNVDIMISHISPYLPEKEEFYYFNGENEIKRIGAKYWIFGHIHYPLEINFGNTKLICNPLGYKNNNFSIKTISIK